MLRFSRRGKLGALLLTLVLFGVLVTGQALANQSGMQIPSRVTGNYAYEVVKYFSETIGLRAAGGPKEFETREYVMNQFKQLGYNVELQPFTYTRRGVQYSSANIIATKPGTKPDNTIIIGAHYDSSSPRPTADGQLATGAGDNASGIGVMLEAAMALSPYKTSAAVKFVAFGAEEAGLKGSSYYASQMSREDVAGTITMINLDCVGMGDYFYVYSGLGDNPGWVRDLALRIGQRMGHDLRTSPESEWFVGGTTGDWSDHVAFRNLGIPIAYFEWMNWDIEPDGGLETAEYGMLMHTGRDNLSFISKDKLEQTAEVVTALTLELGKNPLPKAEKGKIAQGSKYISVQKRPAVAEE